METIKRFPLGTVTNIKIKTALSQVNVIDSSEDDIVLRWTDTKRRKSIAELDGETLTVKDRADAALYGIVGLIWLKEDKEMTLELPSGFDGTVEIDSKDESIRILGVNCPAKMFAKTVVAPIEVSASEIQSCEFKSQGGNISLRGITGQKSISAVTNTGNIECYCSEKSSEYFFDCSSEHGKCNLPVVFKHGKKQIRLHSKTGSVTVNFAENI